MGRGNGNGSGNGQSAVAAAAAECNVYSGTGVYRDTYGLVYMGSVCIPALPPSTPGPDAGRERPAPAAKLSLDTGPDRRFPRCRDYTTPVLIHMNWLHKTES